MARKKKIEVERVRFINGVLADRAKDDLKEDWLEGEEARVLVRRDLPQHQRQRLAEAIRAALM